MTHTRFDLDRWIAEFPLVRLRQEAREFVTRRRAEVPREYPDEAAVERHVRLMMPHGEIVTSPVHMAVNEQLRREAIGDTARADAVPTDVFIMAVGEPPRREATKVGGLPYWPVNRKWPAARDGSPACFLAQINFADSRDLTGELPGEILAVFDCGEAWRGLESDELHFEWVTPSAHALIGTVPCAEKSPNAVFGVIHRTYDLREVPSALQDSRSYSMNRLAVIQATKIGGLPPWTQPPAELPGRYIATLGSVHPAHEIRFPFLNVEEPLSEYGDDHLMWGDVGNLYLFLQNDGAVLGTIDCY
ncbi:MAG: hypothetical protein BroJett003_06080 [Planctomycetota bacterium]|nr:MAG: hypothetical protein BroJett003_06080 [Planctomycetota bacterium]